MQIHDWTRVGASTFHAFHARWIIHLSDMLNKGGLPPDYYADPEQHLGRKIADILTLHESNPERIKNVPDPPEGTVVAVAEAPPQVSRTCALALPSARPRTLTIRHTSGHRIVALIEIVSPGNKSGADDLDEFVRKARDVLRAGIHLAVIDLLPPGRFDPEGIHGAIVEAVTGEKYELPEGEPLTFVSYSSGPEPVAYLQHPHAGDEVPGLPLFLTPAYYIQLPLEPAYAMAWSGVPPSVRTIGLILQRRGALDARRRLRRPPPTPGWYLPDVADERVELESFDGVEGLVIQGGIQVEVLNSVSLHGGLVESWPHTVITAQFTVEAVVEHWQAVGLPGYAQFDNDPVFEGAQIHPNTIGRVARTCMSLGVVSVFVPPRETGFQAAIEGFNGQWQAKVWARFHHDTLLGLQAQSSRYVTAHRLRHAARIEAAPARRRFPSNWHLDLQAHPQGRMVFLRRSNEHGEVQFLGHTWDVGPLWQHRLVRAEVDLKRKRARFYTLRRRSPDQQPLVKESRYVLPRRPFSE